MDSLLALFRKLELVIQMRNENCELKIGIFGGTFNPPHLGHIQSAWAAVQELGLDRLIVVPAGVPPHKALPNGTPSAAARMELAQMAFEDIPNAVVSDIEISKERPSFTVDSIEEIKRSNPDAVIFLIVGTDMYLSLESWKDAERLLGLAIPAVLSRSASDNDKIDSFSQAIKKRYGASAKIVKNPIVEISSSQLREMLCKREGVQYLADACYSHIIKNRYYGAKPDWDWLRARAHSMLAASRMPHVLGCEEIAPLLAERWGVDPDEAREAAILHDITKKLSTSEHLIILENHGIIIASIKNSEEKLLHPRTGAVLAKSEFGASDSVAEAIRWHTTGRRGMTVLEKVVYLIDYIEPTRDFPGVDILRKLAYNNLDEAVILGLEMTIADIDSRSIVPNEASLDALMDLKSQITERTCI